MDTQETCFDFRGHMRSLAVDSMTPVVHYLSAPCGAGKTRAVCNKVAAEWRFLHNVALVFPTLDLIREVSTALTDLEVSHTIITSETHPGKVWGTVLEAINNAPPAGLVLLITWDTYLKQPAFTTRLNWKIVIDEIPCPDSFYPFILPSNPQHITDHLTTSPSRFAGVLSVNEKTPGTLVGILDNAADTVISMFRELYSAVISPNRDVYVEEDAWNRFVEGGKVEPVEPAGSISFVSMLNLDILRNCLIMGAHFEYSLLYAWLASRYKIRLVEDEDLKGSLRFQRHDFGDRVQIHYFLERDRYSKVLKATKDKNGIEVKTSMDAAAIEFFGDRPFLWVANNGDKSKQLDSCRTGIRIPVKSHGLNTYQDVNGIYISAALNRTPNHERLLNKIGLSSLVITRSTSHETYYQCVGRTSLRNPHSTSCVDIIVPDRGSAVALMVALGAACTKMIASNINLNQAYTPSQKNARSRAKKALEVFRQKRLPNPISLIEKGNHFQDRNPSLVHVVRHYELTDVEDDRFETYKLSIEEFLEFFRLHSLQIEKDKDKVMLFNPSTYKRRQADDSEAKPKVVESLRNTVNFVQSSFLALDFDNGQVSPDDFIRLFGRKAPKSNRLSFIIMNTSSRSKEEPNRFRVVIPYTCPATSIEEHKRAYWLMVQMLELHGFDKDFQGLDTTSQSPITSFHLPCRVPGQEDYWLFQAHSMRQDEVMCYGLEPRAIPLEINEDRVVFSASLIDQTEDFPQHLIDGVLSSNPLANQKRHPTVWKIAMELNRLRYHGKKMSFYKFCSTMRSLRPGDRKVAKHVKWAIDRSEKYRWFK